MSHINPNETLMLLIDHQSGLFQLVKDIPVSDLRRNAIALAKVATILKMPVITSASVPDGPNGPLIPEIHQAAPHAQYVGRRGEINVWDSPDFVKAVEATGRKTLILAGTLTSVCMAFPSISAVADGRLIANAIRVHPLALLHFDKLTDEAAKAEILALTAGYAEKTEYFVDQLSRGLARIAAAAYPRPVIVRMSDFKTNEYAGLLGGRQFEPPEENPMIGWRGASRYYSPGYRDGFALECKAIARLRNDMGFTNVVMMIPFCRSTAEADKVLAVMAENGLARGDKGLEVYVMCEIPSNVILAKQFAERFDGFSIGSNDLTQLTLGVDRDNHTVAHVYDENNLAVKELIKHVIKVAKKHHVKIGLCGQAPSDYPEFARFLVEQGIDSISLAPDTIVKTTVDLKKTEEKLGR